MLASLSITLNWSIRASQWIKNAQNRILFGCGSCGTVWEVVQRKALGPVTSTAPQKYNTIKFSYRRRCLLLSPLVGDFLAAEVSDCVSEGLVNTVQPASSPRTLRMLIVIAESLWNCSDNY
jgi:hypothetical protein